jgi:hypothetical protein
MPKTHSFGEKRKNEDLALKSAEKEAYVEWLSTPANLREPKSQAKMAAHLGVTEQTLRAWKRDPRVASAVRSKIQTHLSLNDLGEIVSTLKTQATDPDNPRSVQASKLLIEMMDRADGGVSDNPLADMSWAEIQALSAELYDLAADKQEKKA